MTFAEKYAEEREQEFAALRAASARLEAAPHPQSRARTLAECVAENVYGVRTPPEPKLIFDQDGVPITYASALKPRSRR